MRNALLFLLLSVSGLYATCSSYDTLGDRVSASHKDLPSIVWHAKGKGFTTEPQACQKGGFILLHDNDKEYTKKEHAYNSYTLQRGWNFIHAPRDGVDIAQTFADPNVLFVYIYEPLTPAWAGYSSHPHYKKMMQESRILDLRYIEPSQGFYVYANKKIKLPIVSSTLNKACRDLLESGTYNAITHSTFGSKASQDLKAGISLASLYRSHYRRGIYNDTRVMLLYPKKEIHSNDTKVYGPIEPRVKIEYALEYDEAKFYVFDYFTKRCYGGIFPSKRMPPYPVLQLIK